MVHKHALVNYNDVVPTPYIRSQKLGSSNETVLMHNGLKEWYGRHNGHRVAFRGPSPRPKWSFRDSES
jgi:hypothetical protein